MGIKLRSTPRNHLNNLKNT